MSNFAFTSNRTFRLATRSGLPNSPFGVTWCQTCFKVWAAGAFLRVVNWLYRPSALPNHLHEISRKSHRDPSRKRTMHPSQEWINEPLYPLILLPPPQVRTPKAFPTLECCIELKLCPQTTNSILLFIDLKWPSTIKFPEVWKRSEFLLHLNIGVHMNSSSKAIAPIKATGLEKYQKTPCTTEGDTWTNDSTKQRISTYKLYFNRLVLDPNLLRDPRRSVWSVVEIVAI